MTNINIEYPDQGPVAPITARLLLDSITDGGYRLTSWHLTYPRSVHAELLTHRVFSRCSASSRAIPMARMRRRILDAPFIPLEWGANRPGMQAAGEVEDRAAAEAWWRAGLELAAQMHAAGQSIGLHKQVVNRILEPWMMIEVICSGTEWANFFALRDHRLAEPHIRELARQMRDVYYSRMPTYLPPGGWHLPMVRLDDMSSDVGGISAVVNVEGTMIDISPDECAFLRKISAARCARVSYLNHDGRRDLADDVALHDRLLAPGEPGDPMHACYDAETQVLTDSGWKPWPLINTHDRLMAVDMAGKSTYEVPTRLIARHYKGAMYYVRGQQIDLLVTPEHRMVVSFRQHGNVWTSWQFARAQHLTDRPCRYLKTTYLTDRVQWQNPWNIDPEIWACFVGFFVGDGHAPRYGGNKAQFHLRKQRKIRFLQNLGLPLEHPRPDMYSVRLPGLGRWLRTHCYHADSDKTFPSGVMTITPAEVRGLLEGLRNSDGSTKRQTWIYDTTSPHVRDTLQIVLHLNSLVGSMSIRRPGTPEETARITISRRDAPRVETRQRGRSRTYETGWVEYDGYVYCASVSTGALLVRRNNKAVVSGNSPFEHPAQATIEEGEPCGNFRGWRQYRKLFERESGPDTSVRCEVCGIWAGGHVAGCPAAPEHER